MRRELVARLEQSPHEAWPASSATLLGYELGFSPSGFVVRLRYQAPVALEEAVAAVLQKVFQSRLPVEQLRFQMDWVPPEAPPAPAKKPSAVKKAGSR